MGVARFDSWVLDNDNDNDKWQIVTDKCLAILSTKKKRPRKPQITPKRIVFGINKLNFDDLFKFTKCNSTRANHPYKLYVEPAKCNPYKYSFSIRIVWNWNSLPGSIVEAGSLSRFKSALKPFLNIH